MNKILLRKKVDSLLNKRPLTLQQLHIETKVPKASLLRFMRAFYIQLPNKKWILPNKLWPYENFETITYLEDPSFVEDLTDLKLIAEAIRTYENYAELLLARVAYLKNLGKSYLDTLDDTSS